ncbi:mitochondrial import protein Pam17-domain-containing protein [Dactylonectria estremocensis]|uniref:Presequence translocated-associated motor subunit PAM17 n=1 Tax=Dactylonectria estremocensis TaxID=1079267 RepID=A0A9P9J556_9HYPO|nr:mitochondrial import protein Pam17-domain-containing protein [Dactylonectria estremocensis]
MASSMKTLVMRYPCPAAAVATGRTTSFVPGLNVPKASFSTLGRPVTCLARVPLRQQSFDARIPRTFARANSGLAQNSAAPDSSAPLDWDGFFKMRIKRRRVQLFFSFTSGMLGGGFGAVALSAGLAEPIVTQIPLDPIVTLGLMTFAFSGLGWLIGPSIGSQVFYLRHRKWKQQMTQKEAEFFARIKKHRVNPTNSSASNPVPDFYGEKIQSVAGYRRWLKDQKAFNKKKTANFV